MMRVELPSDELMLSVLRLLDDVVRPDLVEVRDDTELHCLRADEPSDERLDAAPVSRGGGRR